MKKYLYLLIACTMMCFAGCEEKGDEITTDNTGENVEINEADLVGTWKIVSEVEKDGDYFDSIYYYDDHYESHWTDGGESGISTYEMPLWTHAFTLKADKTYEFEEEKVTKTQLGYDGGKGVSILGYDKEYFQEHGTWSLKGKNFVIQWIEGCEKYVYGIHENEDYRTKPYTKELHNTLEESQEYKKAGKDRDDYYDGYFDYSYESERLEAVEEGGEMTCSIIKLTPTELVIHTKYKMFYANEWEEGEITEYYKKVK